MFYGYEKLNIIYVWTNINIQINFLYLCLIIYIVLYKQKIQLMEMFEVNNVNERILYSDFVR